eukprot:SAG11_NODE_1069_length_5978_cov_4.956965_1_plen_173_part_00
MVLNIFSLEDSKESVKTGCAGTRRANVRQTAPLLLATINLLVQRGQSLNPARILVIICVQFAANAHGDPRPFSRAERHSNRSTRCQSPWSGKVTSLLWTALLYCCHPRRHLHVRPHKTSCREWWHMLDEINLFGAPRTVERLSVSSHLQPLIWTSASCSLATLPMRLVQHKA